MNANPKSLKGAALVALLVGLSPMVSAETQTQSEPTSNVQERMHQNRQSADPQTEVDATQSSVRSVVPASLRRSSANELTGMPVMNRSGESLGKVKDFVVDPSSGQVVYAIVGSGGVAGIGESLHAVPVSALQYSASAGQEQITLDIDSTRWSQAPRFRKGDIASLQADREGRSTYQFYGQSWPQSSSSVQLQQQARQSQPLLMVSDVIGKDIRSGAQEVGEIEDVLVQLRQRNAAVVLDADDSFVGTDQKYIVPFNKLSFAGVDAYTTNLTRADFSSAQIAQGDAWASSSGSAGRVYLWPSPSLSASASVDQSGQTVVQTTPPVLGGQKSDDVRRERELESSTNTASSASVAQIRQALQNDSTLAQKGARDVQVVAQGDKLVILGTVQTKEAKDQIEERVERLAPDWDVDNQIRVATAEE